MTSYTISVHADKTGIESLEAKEFSVLDLLAALEGAPSAEVTLRHDELYYSLSGDDFRNLANNNMLSTEFQKLIDDQIQKIDEFERKRGFLKKSWDAAVAWAREPDEPYISAELEVPKYKGVTVTVGKYFYEWN